MHILIETLAGRIRQTEQIEFKLLVLLGKIASVWIVLGHLFLYNWDDEFLLLRGQILHDILIKPLFKGRVF